MNRSVLVGGIVALVLVLAGLGYLAGTWLLGGGAADVAEAPPAAVEAPASAPAPAEVPADAKPQVVKPTFDIARIDNDGNLLVAGRSKPDDEIVVIDNGQPSGTVRADARGEFVFLPDHPLEPGVHELTLQARPKDGVEGDTVEGDEVVLLEAPERGQDGKPQVVAGSPPMPTVKLSRDGSAPATLMGTAKDAALSIDAVDYDETGKLTITGRAAPGDLVVLYLDNVQFAAARAGKQGADAGAWRASPAKTVGEGKYVLRADEIGVSGQVVARVEVPFQFLPFAPKTASEESGEGGESEGARRRLVVVEPGNSLWRLARQVYGSGFQYTVIYRANIDQIRDPDLIYPGQVFDLPATD